VQDNAKVFAGGLLVALLAIALELALALVQRFLVSPGLRAGADAEPAGAWTALTTDRQPDL
jgi:osmoprotectant transport system permease protein